MSNPFSPLILPTEDNRGLQSSLLTVIDALNILTPRLGIVEDILATAGLATRRAGAIPMTWLGVWTASFVYLHGDVTLHGLLLMIANKTTSETPSLGASDWDLVCICATLTQGAFAVTEGVDVLASAGANINFGNLAAPEAIDTLAATGDTRIDGALAVTEATDVLAADGDVSDSIIQPLWSNITYLPDHGVAADESTAIIDRSDSPNQSFIYENNAKNDDADTALGVGGTSILFDQAAGSRVRRAYAGEFRPIDGGSFDSGEFCWEMHVKAFSTGNNEGQFYSMYIATTNSRVMNWKVDGTNGLWFRGWQNGFSGSEFVNLTYSSFTLNVWHHVAVTRENDFSVTIGAEDIIRLFSDGVLRASATVASNVGFLTNRSIGPRFGNQENGVAPFDGRVDNIRIILDEPLYTQNFTPPVARHPMFE